MSSQSAIRPAVNAGRFYPASARELGERVDELLGKASTINQPKASPVGIIVPHAGYDYSGAVAARAYASLAKTFDQVILIGPSHYASFKGVASYDADGIATPLGTVPIERFFIEQLAAKIPTTLLHADEELREHSLEVQLPFLQRTLNNFTVVPLMMYHQSLQDVQRLAEALSALLMKQEKQTLLVASSDLYHGCSEIEEEVQDLAFESYVADMQPESLLEASRQGTCMACGIGPIATVMTVAKRVGPGQSRILARTNSAKVSGSSGGYVVGYLSALLF